MDRQQIQKCLNDPMAFAGDLRVPVVPIASTPPVSIVWR